MGELRASYSDLATKVVQELNADPTMEELKQALVEHLTTKVVQELNAVFTERDQFREEVSRLRAEVAELRCTLEKAQQELRDKAAIVAERDLYLRELEAFWAEKIADMDKNGVDFGEFITELERDLDARGTLDGK